VAEHPSDVAAAMHRALATCLPDTEPPIGLRLDEVVRQGRRRGRVRRAGPVAAAVITVLAVAVSWALASSSPGPDRVATGITTAPPPPPDNLDEYRLPAGHQWNRDAQALARAITDRLPPGVAANHVGSISEAAGTGSRHGFGFHTLWRAGDRFGYLLWLHRTKGDFPATAYGLPVEPCVEPAGQSPSFHCTPLDAPAGDTAFGFEVDSGYRMRGIVWDGKDEAGGPDIRVTIAFYLPTAGAWTPFPVLDDHPTLTAIPLSIDDLARLIQLSGGN
jgi:hypothetical protein